MSSDSLVMNIPEVARALGISRGLAYQLVREGKLPGAIRLGAKRLIVSRVQFEAWLNGDGKATLVPDGRWRP
jgi:excisionase family DNA binding protein